MAGSTYYQFNWFSKAFDSLHRHTLWNSLQSYGIPAEVISSIKATYSDTNCVIRENNQTTEWFIVNTDMKQGYFLSLLLFGIAADWIPKKCSSSTNSGIAWVNGKWLVDPDFTDIAILSNTPPKLQRQTPWQKQQANQGSKSVMPKQTSLKPRHQAVTSY